MRENANDWLYDGVDDNELTRRRRRHPAEHRFHPRVQGPDPQLPAQYGSRGGTTVLVSSKSGENTFHGNAVRVLPQRRAGCAQLLRRGPEAPVEPEHLRRLAGRADRKNKTFFFGGFQGSNIDEGLTTLLTVPTALMHQGIFTESFAGAPLPIIYDPATTRTDPATGLLVRDPFPGNHDPGQPHRPDRAGAAGPAADAHLHRSARRQLPGEPGQDTGRLPGRRPHRSQLQQQRSALRTLQPRKGRAVPADRAAGFRRDRRFRQQPDVQDRRARTSRCHRRTCSATTSSTSSPPVTTGSSTTSPRSATARTSRGSSASPAPISAPTRRRR